MFTQTHTGIVCLRMFYPRLHRLGHAASKTIKLQLRNQNGRDYTQHAKSQTSQAQLWFTMLGKPYRQTSKQEARSGKHSRSIRRSAKLHFIIVTGTAAGENGNNKDPVI